MPPRKRGTSRIPVTLTTDDIDEGEDTPTSATEAALEDAALNAKTRDPIAKVYRVNTSGKNIYLDQVSLAIVNEEWIAETYGGGQYQVYRMGDRDGRWGFLGSDKYDIDESLPFKGSLRKQNVDKGRFGIADDDDDRISFHNQDGSRIGGGGPSSTMVDAAVFNLLKSHQDNAQVSQQFFLTMMEQMRQSSQMERQMMTTMLERTVSQPKNNPLEALMPLLTALAPKFVEMAMNKRDSIETILPLLEKLTPKDEGQKLDDMLSLVSKMKETAEVFGGGGGGGGGGGIWDALGKALEVLPSLVQQQTVARQPQATAVMTPQMQPQALGAAPVMPQPLTDPTMVQSADDVWAMMRQHIGKLKLAAMMNRNAMRVAMVTVEFASDPEKALLTEVLADDTFKDKFLEKFPEMQMHSLWTDNYIESLRDELLGPAPDEDPSEEEEDTPVVPIKGKGKNK